MRAMPKVALLFLAHQGVPHEALWAAFLEAAAGLELRAPPPPSALERETGEVDLRALLGGPLLPGLPPLRAQPERAEGLHLHLPSAQHAHTSWCEGMLMGSAGPPSDEAQLQAAWLRLQCASPASGHGINNGSDAAPAGAATSSGAGATSDGPGAAVSPPPGIGAAAGLANRHSFPLDDMISGLTVNRSSTSAAAGSEAPPAGAACTHPLSGGAWRRFFSLLLYMTPPGRHAPPHSLFCGHQLRTDVDATGGYSQFVLVEAVLALLGAALADPLNARFLLLSGASVPLRPAGLLWAQALAEERSRVATTCPMCARVADAHLTRMWPPAMETEHLRPAHWGMSSQWVTLTRAHAALAVADRHVSEAFRRYCTTGPLRIPKDRRTPSTAAYGAHVTRRAQLAFLEAHWEEFRGCSLAVAAQSALLAGRDWDPRKDGLGGRQGTVAAAAAPGAETGAVPNLPAAQRQSGAVGGDGGGDQGAGGADGAACRGFVEALLRGRMPHQHAPPCVSDTTFFPVLLAVYGLEAQGTCQCGSYRLLRPGSHYVEWGNGWHPVEFQRDRHYANYTEARARLLGLGAQPHCDSMAAGRRAALQRLFVQDGLATSGRNVATHAGDSSSGAARGGGDSSEAGSAEQPGAMRAWLQRASGFEPMSPECPLFARKFTDVRSTFPFVVSCDGLGIAAWCQL